jgi:hypothetical protein
MALKHLLKNSMKLLKTCIRNTHPLPNCNLFVKVQVRAWCMHQTIWEKKVFCNRPCKLNFWIAMTTCNSLYFYVVSTIGQVAWVAKITTRCVYGAIHCNSITTIHFQLWCNSPMITTIMSC